MVKRIALIEKNKCNFDRLGEFAGPLLYEKHNAEERIRLKNGINDYIWSVIEPYITFIDINTEEEDFLTVVCQNLTKCYPERKPDEFFYHTESSYSFPKKFIEIIYCQPIWSEYESGQAENMNNLACLFSLKHNVVENSCVVLVNNFDLSATKLTVIDSVTKEDILAVVRRRFFFSAVLISDESITKYYYQDPKYLITKVFGLDIEDKIEKLAFSHLKYNLVFYFQQNKTKYLNKIATRINGLYRVHGDVLVLHEMEENIFANISLHEIKRLNVLSYGRLYDRQLKDDEVHTIPTIEVDENGKEIEKKITPLWSKYLVVEKRMSKWLANKNKCINCEKEITRPIICQKCFRAKYCSLACEKEFYGYHYEECLN